MNFTHVTIHSVQVFILHENIHATRMATLCANLGVPRNDGLDGEASPERGSFFRFQVYKRVGISKVEVYDRVRKSVF